MRLVKVGEDIEVRVIAITVGPDECCDGPPLNLKMLDVDGNEPAKMPVHVVGHQDGVGFGRTWLVLDGTERRQRGLSGRGATFGRGRRDRSGWGFVSGHRAPTPSGRRGCLGAGTASAA